MYVNIIMIINFCTVFSNMYTKVTYYNFNIASQDIVYLFHL